MDRDNSLVYNEKQSPLVSPEIPQNIHQAGEQSTDTDGSQKVSSRARHTGESEDTWSKRLKQTTANVLQKTQTFTNSPTKTNESKRLPDYIGHSSEQQRLLGFSKISHEIDYLCSKSDIDEDNRQIVATSTEAEAGTGDYRDKAKLDGLDGPGMDAAERSSAMERSGLLRTRTDSCKVGKEKFKFRKISTQHKTIIILLAAANFSHMVGYSLMAPFFPREAMKKGVSQAVTGLIFSSFEFCVFVSAPIYGIYLTKVGASFMFMAGISVAGVCSILFGLLHYCSPTWFIVLCFLTRALEALGISAYTVASLAIASSTFPNHIGVIFGLMETALSLGLMVGPLFGSLLYELGGYGLPFYVMGLFVMTIGVLVGVFLPRHQAAIQSCALSVWTLLRSGQVWVTAATICTAAYGMGFLEPHLSVQAMQIGIPEIYIGFLFVIMPVFYAVMAPFWGWLSDTKGVQGTLIVFGNLFSVIAYLILGPSPVLPFLPTSPWVLIASLVLFGLSFGCVIMPTMKCLIQGAQDVGFADDLATFGLVSGLFNSFYCLGSFVGPSVGGLLVETFDFRVAATINGCLFLLPLLAAVAYFGHAHYRRQRHSDYSHLPLRIHSDQDSLPVDYHVSDDETAHTNSLAVLSLSMRAGMARHYYNSAL